MRIGVDAHILTEKFQGSRTYLLNLLRHVAAIDSENEYLVYSTAPGESRTLFGEASERFDCRPIRSRGPVGRLALEFPRIVRRDGLDLFYSQYISPVFGRCLRAVTIHDILFESLPRFFSRFFVARSRALIRHSARRAEVVFTDSEFSRRELLERYGIEPEKTHITYCAVDRNRFRPLTADAMPPSAEKYRRHSPYILFVGRLDPRKNVTGLLAAMALRKQRGGLRETLLITGPRDYRHRDVFEAIERHGLRDRVVFLEGVADDELPILYNLAEVFVYPSYGEGFGLPVLEAMACGTPVATTNRGSLAEVAGDAAHLVNPDSPESIEEAIALVIGDAAARESMRRSGLRQAEKFSWEQSARVFHEAIRKLS